MKPAIDLLEDRRLMSGTTTYTVTNPGDAVTNSLPASGTLRWAV
jgi:hypothetical protein